MSGNLYFLEDQTQSDLRHIGFIAIKSAVISGNLPTQPWLSNIGNSVHEFKEEEPRSDP